MNEPGQHEDRKKASGGMATDSEARYLSRAIALGTNMAAGMAVFTFLGYWIDRWRGGSGTGVWTLVGMFVGLLYGGYEVWKVVRLFYDDGGTDVSQPKDGRKQG
jgi:F0F1-type ATP synthase assembly protein I